ncbi:kunitz-type protease inhibitor 4 isoform X1 [Corvus cornix cornix]|nr:kunitz-type protease inhibitor 4 isoform X1 [Corvus cornix cornix]
MTSWPLCPAAKPGYCYHIPEVEDLLDKDCGSCHTGASCSHCTSDADCHGVTKCCPSKCGYTCQEPVLDFCYLPSVCGNCKALFRRFFFNASSQQCEEFIYGGCGGNRNNFETKGECFQACSHLSN